MPDKQNISISFHRQIKICILATIAIFLFYPALLLAEDNYWNVASGDWSA